LENEFEEYARQGREVRKSGKKEKIGKNSEWEESLWGAEETHDASLTWGGFEFWEGLGKKKEARVTRPIMENKTGTRNGIRHAG